MSEEQPAPRVVHYTVYPGRISKKSNTPKWFRIVVPSEIPFGEYIMRVAEDGSQVTYLPAPENTMEDKYLISKRSSGKRGIVKSITIDKVFASKRLAFVNHKDGSFSYITPEKYQEILQQVKPLVASIVPIAVPVIALTVPVEKKEEQ